MNKCNTESVARSLAAESKLHYGVSVFDGKFYVGDVQELQDIGVIELHWHDGTKCKPHDDINPVASRIQKLEAVLARVASDRNFRVHCNDGLVEEVHLVVGIPAPPQHDFMDLDGERS